MAQETKKLLNTYKPKKKLKLMKNIIIEPVEEIQK